MNTIDNNNSDLSNTTTSQEQDMETTEQDTSAESDTLSAESDTADSLEASGEAEVVVKEKAAPAHIAFVAAVKAHAESLGLSQKDQKGFFQVWNATTGHKLYVAKQGRNITRIDTTLPEDALSGIALPLEKPNGRIACHVEATTEAVSLALDVLASYQEKIPSPKRAAKADAVEQAAVTE